MKKLMTLCVIHQHPNVLLGLKKRGFGVGRWNGFGGKVLEGESVVSAVKRELMEETGLEAVIIEKRGVIDFVFENDPKVLEVHIFYIGEFNGTPLESEEMKPQWYHVDDIPFKQMWPDDIHWMPIFLSGKKFKGKFIFDRPSDTEYTSKILAKSLSIVENV